MKVKPVNKWIYGYLCHRNWQQRCHNWRRLWDERWARCYNGLYYRGYFTRIDIMGGWYFFCVDFRNGCFASGAKPSMKGVKDEIRRIINEEIAKQRSNAEYTR